MSERFELRRARDSDADVAADVFISSRATALPTVNFPYSDDSVRHYVRDILIGKTEGWVARRGRPGRGDHVAHPWLGRPALRRH